MISRNVYLPFPVVTDHFILTVNNGTTPILFMMDVIGSDPVTKYSVDPMLSPAIYKDCKLTYNNAQNLWLLMSIYF